MNSNSYTVSYRWIGQDELHRKGEPHGFNYINYNTHRYIIEEPFDAVDEEEAIQYGMDFIESDMYAVFGDGLEVYNYDTEDYEDRPFVVDVDYIDEEIRVYDAETNELYEIYTDFRAELEEL